MAQNILPDIQLKIGKPRINQQSIHSLNTDLRKRMSINRGDVVRRSFGINYQNQGVGHHGHLNQYVRMSFSNKTVVYRKRVGEEKEGQCHQSNRVVIMKQSPRVQTQPNCSELRGCRSLLNSKTKSKRSFFEPKRMKEGAKQLGHHNSLMDIYVSQKIGRCEDKSQDFQLLPWQTEESRLRIDERALKPRHFV